MRLSNLFRQKVFVLLLMLVITPVPGADEAALTNEDILRLMQAGLGTELIIARIRSGPTDFDLSVEQLVGLKEAGIADSVIAAMMGIGTDAPAEAEKPPEHEESDIITYPALETKPAGPSGSVSPGTSQAPPQKAPAASAAPVPGSSFRDTLSGGGEGPVMVVIPAGRFMMGCVSGQDCRYMQKPVHEVVIARPLAISKYEITFEDYDRFTYPNKVDDEGWGRGNRPVINVSWDDATEYAAWLSAQTGKRYRLPSEAEWEYAARAGSTTKYSWGNDIGHNRANCVNEACGDQWLHTAPVGSFSANSWGLHDMHGNVWEWVQDCWNDSYAGAPGDGSAWASGDCSLRVLRGGSWDVLFPEYLRSAYRFRYTRADRHDSQGFRLVQDL